MRIIAIDPGNTESGVVRWEHGEIATAEVSQNDALLSWLSGGWDGYVLAIEMMRPRGMPMSIEAMDALVWIGRFKQRWLDSGTGRDADRCRLIDRIDVKMHLCGSARAKDSNIRQALLDKVGPRGTKRAPGPTYLVTSHCWAALAVAVTLSETQR